MYRQLSIAVVAAVAFGVISTARAQAASIEFQNFYVSYRYLPDNQQPGNDSGHVVPENAINVAYVNGWTYGSNFLDLDFEQFSKGDPSSSISSTGPNLGSSEFYGVFRTTLSGNKISGTHDFSFGPIADVGLRLGGDYDIQNDQFGSYKRLIVAGPQFDIAMPKGFWNISLEVTHEWDTNGFAYPNGPSDSFAPAPAIETAWMYPFNIGPVPLQFTGFVNIIGPKGRGYSEPKGYQGDFYHRTEILAHPKILVDVGSLVGYTPGKLMAGIGYEYWMNKFGNYKPHVDGAQQHSVFFEVGYNFD